MQTLKITSVTESFMGKATPSLRKVEIRRMAIDGIKNAKRDLYTNDGVEEATCSGSYDLGYYEGMLRCLELLKKKH